MRKILLGLGALLLAASQLTFASDYAQDEASFNAADDQNTSYLPYAQRRQYLIQRTNRLEAQAGQQGDVEILRNLQRVELVLIEQLPQYPQPWDDVETLNAALASAERTLNLYENLLNEGNGGREGASCNYSIYPPRACAAGFSCVTSGVPGASGTCRRVVR